MSKVTSLVLAEIQQERESQDARWGEQNPDPEVYLAILTEEVGELAQAMLHKRFLTGPWHNLRKEAVQVAAVAVARYDIPVLLKRNLKWPEEHQEWPKGVAS